jgi:hypothetical protein
MHRIVHGAALPNGRGPAKNPAESSTKTFAEVPADNFAREGDPTR